MASIHLYQEHARTDTSVPNQFIDQYMPQANGEFVKVYLYLLRCLSDRTCDCSVSKIADTFNHTENDVIRALNYWEREKLLQMEYNEAQQLTGIRLLDFGASTHTVADITPSSNKETLLPDANLSTAAKAEPAISANAPWNNLASKKEYSLDEIKSFRQNPDISELFFITEMYLKHPLSSTDTNTILYWYDALEFSTELIEYLVEYCISKGHSSIRYMDKVAIAWKERNITTVMQAKEEAAIHSQVYYGVIKALGITGRNLVDNEQQFIQKWTKEYQFDLDLIQEACGRTVSAIHQPSFEYTDSILSNWYQKGVRSIVDIKALDEEFEKKRKETTTTATTSNTSTQQSTAVKRNKFANFNQREYDYDQLEKLLLNSSVE